MSAIDAASNPVLRSYDLVRRRSRARLSKTLLFSSSIALIFVLVGVLAPVLAPYDPLQMFPGHVLKPADEEHLLGTDELGRDLLSRVIYGARLSLLISFCVVVISTVTGVTLGTLASYYGGIVDMLIMRAVDLILAFPNMILVIAVSAYLGNTIPNLIIVMGLLYTPGIARITYTYSLAIKSKDYVQASRLVGVPNWRVMLRHVLPNAIAPLLAYVALNLGFAILMESGLSFLGLGPPPPTPTWGSLIAVGRRYVHRQPTLLVVPVVAVSVIILAFNLMGDSLRDILDPRVREV